MRNLTLSLLVAIASTCPCTPAQVAKRLTTLFAQDNFGLPGYGNFFDLKVTNEKGLTITAIDVHVSDTTAGSIDVYTCPTTFLGKSSNPAVWTKLASGSGIGAGIYQPTSAPLTPPLQLGPGSYGMAIYYNNWSLFQTNGTGAYANADAGIATGETRSGLFSGFMWQPRIWNGTIHYTIAVGSATLRTFGAGCRGSNGTPSIDQSPGSWPDLGKTLSIAAKGLPVVPGVAAMVLGISSTAWGALPLPFDLEAIGMPGCKLLASDEVTLGYANTGGTGTWSLAVPLTPSLLGCRTYLQGIEADPATNALGFTTTNGIEITLGQ